MKRKSMIVLFSLLSLCLSVSCGTETQQNIVSESNSHSDLPEEIQKTLNRINPDGEDVTIHSTARTPRGDISYIIAIVKNSSGLEKKIYILNGGAVVDRTTAVKHWERETRNEIGTIDPSSWRLVNYYNVSGDEMLNVAIFVTTEEGFEEYKNKIIENGYLELFNPPLESVESTIKKSDLYDKVRWVDSDVSICILGGPYFNNGEKSTSGEQGTSTPSL